MSEGNGFIQKYLDLLLEQVKQNYASIKEVEKKIDKLNDKINQLDTVQKLTNLKIAAIGAIFGVAGSLIMSYIQHLITQ